MKNTKLRWFFVCALALTAVLLDGCAAGKVAQSGSDAGQSGFSASAASSAESSAPADSSRADAVTAWTELVCRVVHRDGDVLLLAQQQGSEHDIFLLDLTGLPDEEGLLPTIVAGELVYVAYDGTQTCEIPLHLSGVELVSRARGAFDDQCVLYLQVLEDLWVADPGLSSGIEMISVDLSATGLCASEQAALAWLFAQNHDVSLVEGDYEQLLEQGYLTPDDPENPNTLYHWADGCLFSITEKPMDGVYMGLHPITFDAMKWRSGLGAYLFADCTAVRNGSGRWSEYTVGSHAIA